MASTAAGATAAGVVAPQGPFPRGTADPSLAPDPATTGPVISVLAPARGAAITSTTTLVRLEVEDVNDVASVEIAGSPATPDGPNQWIAQVRLVAGLNVIPYVATDKLGNASEGYVSVIHGSFRPAQDMLSRSVGVAITPAGLARVADETAALTSSVSLNSILTSHNPLVNVATLKVEALQLIHAPLRFEIEGAPGGVLVRVYLPTPELDIRVQAVGLSLTQAKVTADQAIGVVRARINRQSFTGGGVLSNRALGLDVDSFDITFDNFRFQATSGVVQALLSPFRGTIERAIVGELRDILVDLAKKYLGNALPGIDSPVALSIPNPLMKGQTLGLDLQGTLDEAGGDRPTGLGLVAALRLNANVPDPKTHDQVFSSGIRVDAPAPGPEAFAVRLSEDSLNGLFHAAWQTGGAQIRLRGRAPSPTQTLAINVGIAYPFLPQLRSLAPDPRTPLDLEVSFEAPPIVRLGRTQGTPLEVAVGEVEVRVKIDYMDGQPPLELFALRFAGTLGGNVSFLGNALKIDGLKALGPQNQKALTVDIIREPATDLADQEIEDFLHSILPMLLKDYLPQIPTIQIPALPYGLQLSSPRIEYHPGTITLRGDL